MTKQQLQEALVAETRRADHNWTEVGNFKAEVTGIKDPSILPNERVKILDAIVSTWGGDGRGAAVVYTALLRKQTMAPLGAKKRSLPW